MNSFRPRPGLSVEQEQEVGCKKCRSMGTIMEMLNLSQ